MSQIKEVSTPPEWEEWHWIAKLVYVVLFIGGMGLLYLFSHWFAHALFG